MANGIELAVAYVSITGETRQLVRDINRAFAEADKSSARSGKVISRNLEAGLSGTKNSAARAGSEAADAYEQALKSSVRGERIGEAIGRPIGKGIGTGIKVGIGVAAAGATAAVGALTYALTSGFERLKSIDNARFKLKALGNSAEEVNTIMESATESVKGTAFSLDKAANTAASAVAAGIKPGKELTKYLSTAADAAAVAGTSLDEMGSIFNKVQTNGKAYTDDLQQLADRGLPIFTWLQEAYGVTGEALSKMVQDGKVDAATFQQAIETHIGGAAKDMGQSLEGSIENMKASIARLGANFLAPILGMDPLKEGSDAAAAVQRITDKLNEMGAWVLAHQGDIKQYFDVGVDVAKDLGSALASVAGFLKEHPELIKTVAGAFVAWKTISGVSSLLGSLGTISSVLRNDLPASANAGVAGINKALALIVVPAIGIQIGQEIEAAIDNNPTLKWLSRLNHFGTPDVWADAFKHGTDPDAGPMPTDPRTGLPASQSNAPANARDTGGLPATINGLPAAQSTAPAGTRESGGLPEGVFVPYDPAKMPRRASGGPIFGSGPKGKDSVPIMAAPGEHMLTASEVDALGGQSGAYALRAAIRAGAIPGFSNGGAIKQGSIPWIDQEIGATDKDRRGTSPDPNRGNNPNQKGLPDWSEGGKWGDPPPGWFDKPVDPDDYLFPEWWPPGMRDIWKHPYDRNRIKPFAVPGFENGGAIPDPHAPYEWMYQQGIIGHNNFNEAIQIDTSRAAVVPPTTWDKWSLTMGDLKSMHTNRPPLPQLGYNGERYRPKSPDSLYDQDPLYDVLTKNRKGGIPGFENGGAIPAIDYAYRNSGQPYQYGAFDCSMFMSQIYARMAGLPPGRYFTTDSDFEALGFKRGYKPGALNVGTNGGTGTNGHMAGTLPNGINVENAGSAGSMYGEGAKGANDFSQQWYYEPPNSGDMGDMQQHGMSAGMPPGPVGGGQPSMGGMPVAGGDGAALPTDSGRTEGYIPAGAGNTSVAGTSFVSGLYNMGAEAINGLIDQAASAAATAASAAATAGSFGAGGQAAGPAAAFAIGLGANAAKRGVSYGAQMLGIGTDALIEQLTPFGAPRWLSTDVTAFMPQGAITPAATTTAEQMQQPGGQPVAAGQQPVGGPQPPAMPHQGSGSAPGPGTPTPPLGAGTPGPQQAGQPVTPEQTDWWRNIFSFDQGGVLEPGMVGKNFSSRPEYVFTEDQMAELSPGTGAGITINGGINGMDPERVGDELTRLQRRNSLQYQGRP